MGETAHIWGICVVLLTLKRHKLRCPIINLSQILVSYLPFEKMNVALFLDKFFPTSPLAHRNSFNCRFLAVKKHSYENFL